MSDPRAALAREAHRLSKEADALAARHRDQRDHLVRALREEDPARWTYTSLAKAVGITPELVAAIVKHRTGTRRARAGHDRPPARGSGGNAGAR